MNTKRIILALCSIIMLPALTGCLLTTKVGYTPDGEWMVSHATTTTVVAGTDVTYASICKLETALTPAEQAKHDPTKAKCSTRDLKIFGSNPTIKEVITSSSAPVLTAITQGQQARMAIERQADVCAKKGGCGGPSTVINNQNLASAAAVNDTKIGVNVGTAPACAKDNTCAKLGD